MNRQKLLACYNQCMSDNTDKKIDELARMVANGFSSVENKISDFKNETNTRFEKIDKRFEKVDRQFEKIDENFREVNMKLHDIDDSVRKHATRIERLEENVNI